MASHIVKASLEGTQVSVRHTQDRVCRLHNVRVLDSLCQLITHQAVTHIGIEHRCERKVTQRRCLGVLNTVDSRTTLTAVERACCGILSLHSTHRLHRVTLLLLSCCLIGSTAFLFCLSALTLGLTLCSATLLLTGSCLCLTLSLCRCTLCHLCLTALLGIELLIIVSHTLAVQLLRGVETLHKSLLLLLGHSKGCRSIRHRSLHTRRVRKWHHGRASRCSSTGHTCG